MAATGYTPIQLYYSTTAAAVPTAGNLASGELAINITDGKLYYKSNAGVVTLLAGATAGPAGGSNTQVQFNSSGVLAGDADLTFDGTTLTANALTVTNAVTLSGGTANGVLYLNGSKVVTSGSALQFDGTNLGLGGSPVSVGVAGMPAYAALSATSGRSGAFYWQDTGANNVAYSYFFGSVFQFGTSTNHPVAFIQSGSEQMRLTSTGLGIGTSSPSTKLEVAQNSSGVFSPSAAITGTSAGAVLRLAFDSQGARVNIVGGRDSATVGSTAAYMAFETRQSGGGMTEGMRLDSAGNLGLGVTPSAWNGSRLALQIGGANGGYVTADNGLALGSNYAYVSGDKFVANGYAPLYFMSKSAGSHQWYISNNNASGAGATVSFTQAMTLDANGSLIVGSTSSMATSASTRGQVSVNGSTDSVFSLGVGGTYTGFFYAASTTINFGSRTAIPLTFHTSDTERMRISAGGNVGIGTATTATRLFVDQGSDSNGIALAYSGRGSSRTEWELSGVSNENCSWIHNNGTNRYVMQTMGRDAIVWRINDTEAARIDSSSNLLIGTSSNITYGGQSSTGLTIAKGTVRIGVQDNGDGGIFSTFNLDRTIGMSAGHTYGTGAGFAWIKMTPSGVSGGPLVAAMAGSGGVALVNGATSWASLSDIRLKDVTGGIENALAGVMQLEPIRFTWKSDSGKKPNVGLSAQSVQQVVPEAVDAVAQTADNITDKTEYLTVRYQELIPLLTAALQELKTEFDAYKASHP